MLSLKIRIPVDRLQNKNKKQIGIELQLFSYKPDGNYYYYSISPKTVNCLSVKSLYKMDRITPFDEKLNLQVQSYPVCDG